MRRVRHTASAIAEGMKSSICPLTLVSLLLGLSALLGLGWGGSPVRLHAPGAAVWATVAGTFGVIDLCRAPRESDRRFVAGIAVALAVVGLITALLVIVSFVPCGGKCL
jgi:hypothetical protein